MGGTMTMTAELPLMTAEQFLALPDDGVERSLVRGELLESRMTMRGRRHTRVAAGVAHVLTTWLVQLPEPRGEVLAGEAGFRLAQGPDTLVGVDVAYISAAMAAAHPDDTFVFDGPPRLAVEILSPSDTYQGVTDKIATYLAAGVPLVWLVDPVFQTVVAYRPGREPEMFNRTHDLDGGTVLPGFACRVADLFLSPAGR